MTRHLAFVIMLVAGAAALDWSATGGLGRARFVFDLVQDRRGRLYAGTTIDTNGLDSGAVFISADLVNWDRSDLPGDQPGVFALVSGAGDTLFAGSSSWDGSRWQPRVYRSDDHGATWSVLGTIPTPVGASSVWALLERPDLGLVAGIDWLSFHTSAMPVYSTDRGATWQNGARQTQYSPISEYCLLAADDGNLYVGTWAAQRRLVYRSADQGLSWTETDTMFDSGRACALAQGPDGLIFAGTYPKTVPQENIGRVFRSSNSGATWHQVGYGSFATTTGIRSLLWAGDGRLYAGTTPNGEVFSSTDTGITWTSEGRLPGAANVFRLLEVQAGDTNFIYAATGPSGTVFRARLSPPVGARESGHRPRPGRAAILPNPVRTGFVTLQCSMAGTPGISVFDASGRLVFSSSLRMESSPLQLDLRVLPPGVYLLRLNWAGGHAAQRLVVAP